MKPTKEHRLKIMNGWDARCSLLPASRLYLQEPANPSRKNRSRVGLDYVGN